MAIGESRYECEEPSMKISNRIWSSEEFALIAATAVFCAALILFRSQAGLVPALLGGAAAALGMTFALIRQIHRVTPYNPRPGTRAVYGVLVPSGFGH
jgi:hypothetical protein